MSLDFNGSTSLVGLPVDAILRPALPVTLAAWIRLDTLKLCGILTTNKTTTTHRGAYIYVNDASGFVACEYGDNGGITSADRRTKLTSGASAVASGVWQHFAASLRGAGDMTIYINGVDAGGAYSGTGGGQQYNTGVGGRIGATQAFTDGLVADAGIWNVSLSTAEVLAMAKGVPAKMVRPGSLLANYPLWNATNPTIDLSSNSLEASTLTDVTIANHAPVGCPFPVAV